LSLVCISLHHTTMEHHGRLLPGITT
jgi:hypothetical protein